MSAITKTAIQITEKDQVATATVDLFPDDSVIVTGSHQSVTLKVLEEVPAGHKIAIKNIHKGDKIYKYGEAIGVATKDIVAGGWVHVHNCWGTKARRFYREES